MDFLIYLVLISVFTIVAIYYLLKRDMFARLRKSRKNSERVLIEDALKNIYDCEYNKIDCTINYISGGLSISVNKTTALMKKLEEMKLIYFDGAKILLTNDGRKYALKIIRIHRLWEKYLADNTSISEKDWHTYAESIEHKLSLDDVNTLAAKLGNPLLDPHGDPIPTEFGYVHKREELRLSEFSVNEYGIIVHVEDEPKEIYAQIVALGLHPGMQVKVIETSNERIRFEADGEECVLAPIFASYINLVKIRDEEKIKESFETLTSLDINEDAVVLKISNALRGQQRRRLLDLGIVPGTKISAKLKSLRGDPTAYEVRGTTIALRKNQSDLIFVKRTERKSNGD